MILLSVILISGINCNATRISDVRKIQQLTFHWKSCNKKINRNPVILESESEITFSLEILVSSEYRNWATSLMSISVYSCMMVWRKSPSCMKTGSVWWYCSIARHTFRMALPVLQSPWPHNGVVSTNCCRNFKIGWNKMTELSRLSERPKIGWNYLAQVKDQKFFVQITLDWRISKNE